MYHLLDSEYRPVGQPDAPPQPPASASRVKSFIYGCASFAEEEAVERLSAMAGASSARRMGAA
jgi:hypothetical protein